jgi:hypothetical protein
LPHPATEEFDMMEASEIVYLVFMVATVVISLVGLMIKLIELGRK